MAITTAALLRGVSASGASADQVLNTTAAGVVAGLPVACDPGDVVVIAAGSVSSVAPTGVSDVANNTWTPWLIEAQGTSRMAAWRCRIPDAGHAIAAGTTTPFTALWGNINTIKTAAAIVIKGVDPETPFDLTGPVGKGNSGVVTATIGDRSRAEAVVIAVRFMDLVDTYTQDPDFVNPPGASLIGANQQNRILRISSRLVTTANEVVQLDELNQVSGVTTARNWIAGLAAWRGPAPPSTYSASNLLMGV